jgi:HAD superfamily hydrolase (TIGR01484 family)
VIELLRNAARRDFQDVSVLLCDLDDTLTFEGRLLAASFDALEQLEAAGLHIIVVTGRPAGWCDMIARMWPVAAVVGENGAFYFRYDRQRRQMLRRFQRSDEQRRIDQLRLAEIFEGILDKYPHVRLSADQSYRISDYAVDMCEDVAPLGAAEIEDIVAIFTAGGATAKISSIHVNAWIGEFSKLQMSLALLNEVFGVPEEQARKQVVYVGDSPNDEPMFEYFPRSVGVANIKAFLPSMRHHPAWVTEGEGAYGFVELCQVLQSARTDGKE